MIMVARLPSSWTSSTARWCQVLDVSVASGVKMRVADSWLYMLVLLLAARLLAALGCVSDILLLLLFLYQWKTPGGW